MTTYISDTEIAKMLRKRLKASFPGVKFSVRKRGGSAINIDWTDGPTMDMVKPIADGYCGGGFDGMIDMAYSVDSWLMPDGFTMTFASTDGTTDSMGMHSAAHTDKPHPDAVKAQSGAKFVFCARHISPELLARGLERTLRKWHTEGAEDITVEASDYDGSGQLVGDVNAVKIDAACQYGTDLRSVINHELYSYVPASFLAGR